MALKSFEPRKTTPKVKNGFVQKKNRHRPTPTYWNTPPSILVIDKERPGRGYRHLLRKDDIVRFIELLPEWDELSKGLDAVLLAEGRRGWDGWYNYGIVGICAWSRTLPEVWSLRHFRAHEPILAAIGVPTSIRGKDVICEFNAETARAYQLLHIFLHELGHHHDRISTLSQEECARGESYAEEYARRYEKLIFERYCETFELVPISL